MQNKVDIVHEKAVQQSLEKPANITTCAHLANHLSDTLFQKHSDCDELHLVFDRYDIPLSLKSATRERRQGNKHLVSYRITDSTYIAKVPMKRLLSKSRTKMQLTEFLAVKSFQRVDHSGKSLVVAWWGQLPGK